MEKSKGETFVGFTVRAKKCKIGVNACNTLRGAKLVIVCKTSGESTLNDAKKLAKKFKCPIIQTVKKPLEEIVFKDNAKVMAVTDAALADAVKSNLGDDFIEIV
ncbi:MAG: hypothetical protein SPL13_02905 [Clostridia bacterium]|nr:hypothetical protein [Clostridia bacterium]